MIVLGGLLLVGLPLVGAGVQGHRESPATVHALSELQLSAPLPKPAALQPPPSAQPVLGPPLPGDPVVVIALAGSIGAQPRYGYARQLRQRCINMRLTNLARTSFGAKALRGVLAKYLEQQPHSRRERYLLYGASLNSIGRARHNIDHLRRTFALAHKHGMRVVALGPTPWGALRDPRFKGRRALVNLQATRAVRDFLLGRLSPAQALGARAGRSTWREIELPDIAIDLYDSDLRDKGAARLDAGQMQHTLERLGVDDPMQQSAELLADMPRWFLRRELQSFDHVHLNEAGHRQITELVCPQLPATWGCDCRPPPGPPGA